MKCKYMTSGGKNDTKEEAFNKFKKRILEQLPQGLHGIAEGYLNMEFIESNDYIMPFYEDKIFYMSEMSSYMTFFKLLYKNHSDEVKPYTSLESKKTKTLTYLVQVVDKFYLDDIDDIVEEYRGKFERLHKGILTQDEKEQLERDNECAYDDYEMTSEKEYAEYLVKRTASKMKDKIMNEACKYKKIEVESDFQRGKSEPYKVEIETNKIFTTTEGKKYNIGFVNKSVLQLG